MYDHKKYMRNYNNTVLKTPEAVAAKRLYDRTHLKEKRERRSRRKEWFNSLKAKPCADCGKQYPSYVMQFDHLNGKEFQLSQGYWKTKETILREVAKCEVVCANCHMERTFGSRRRKNDL